MNGRNSENGRSSQPRLHFSEVIGKPPYLLDPSEIDRALPVHPQNPCVKRVEKDVVVKYGSGVRMAEAEAMYLVSQRTTICIPKLIGAYILDEVTYIVMSYEPGKSLATYWKLASDKQKELVVGQLKDYVSQLRSIKGNFVGGVDGTYCKANIFDWDYAQRPIKYGPFHSEDAFNEGIVEALRNRGRPHPAMNDPTSQVYNNEWQLAQHVRSLRGHEIVMTHGDLNAGNILVRDDGTVVLIDWGEAGFWPEYWEFYMATFMGTFQADFIRQIERFIPPFYMEAYFMRLIFDKMVGTVTRY